jgi:hypothetical protein
MIVSGFRTTRIARFRISDLDKARQGLYVDRRLFDIVTLFLLLPAETFVVSYIQILRPC